MIDETQDRNEKLVDTTDCLEAVGVFRSWKNFLFVIALVCLLLLQAMFWFANAGYIAKADNPGHAADPVVVDESQQIEQAAKEVTAEVPAPPEPAAAEPAPSKAGPRFTIDYQSAALLIRFLDFVLIIAAALYCLTLLGCLALSLLGRLGGMNHISRAFFLSLLFAVLLLPWHRFFGSAAVGAIYTAKELLPAVTEAGPETAFDSLLYYLRFVVYWLIVVLILMAAQVRSIRWSKAILRRLEVI
jgi:hypothetical protein